jgi:hypothetical protein
MTRRREPTNGSRDRWLRFQASNELLRLSLAFVPRHAQHFPMVLGREMRREEPDGRQIQQAIAEHLKNNRELACGPGGRDSSVGGVLRQVKDVRAIDKERRAAFGQVQTPLVKYSQMRDEGRRHDALARGKLFHPLDEFMIGELSHGGKHVWVHGLFIPWGLSIASQHLQCPPDRQILFAASPSCEMRSRTTLVRVVPVLERRSQNK